MERSKCHPLILKSALIVQKLNHPSKPLCWRSFQAEEAFQALEKVITVMLVLAMPNFSNMLVVVETDALDGELAQCCPNTSAYMSEALDPAKWAWPTYAKEMLAIMEVMWCWRPYFFWVKNFRSEQTKKAYENVFEYHILAIATFSFFI